MPNKKLEDKMMNSALDKIITPSIFDRFVSEIDANEIPTEYIEKIVVYYFNGSIVELSGDEIAFPVPVNRDGTADDMNDSFKQMREVKVLVNTEKLENDVNRLVHSIFKNRC